MGFTIDWGTVVISVPLTLAATFGAIRFVGKSYLKNYLDKELETHKNLLQNETEIHKKILDNERSAFTKNLEMELEKISKNSYCILNKLISPLN